MGGLLPKTEIDCCVSTILYCARIDVVVDGWFYSARGAPSDLLLVAFADVFIAQTIAAFWLAFIALFSSFATCKASSFASSDPFGRHGDVAVL